MHLWTVKRMMIGLNVMKNEDVQRLLPAVILNFLERLSAMVLRSSPPVSINSGLTTQGLKSLVWEKLLGISWAMGLRLPQDLVEVMQLYSSGMILSSRLGGEARVRRGRTCQIDSPQPIRLLLCGCSRKGHQNYWNGQLIECIRQRHDHRPYRWRIYFYFCIDSPFAPISHYPQWMNHIVHHIVVPDNIQIQSSMKQQQSNSRLWQTSFVSALAFSPEGDYCAIATKQDHVVHLYRVRTPNDPDSWQLIQQFKELTQTVSDIDWASDRKIVTASHDRSVVVWRQVGEAKWEKMLVNIDIKLSILVARWAPSARKFAMGSACNTLAISYYNNEETCWVITSKGNLTRAPITTLSFHPSSNLLAIGSADFSVKIVSSSFRASKDPLIIASKVEDYQYNGPFKNVDSMFEILFTVENLGGWINYVSFENNGTSLLVLPHTNHLKVYDIAQGAVVAGEEDVQWNGLPFLSGYITNNKELILGGFNKKVARFTKKGKYGFEGYFAVNEKTNAQRTKKGAVSNFTKNIEANKSIYSEGPAESDHVNSIKVTAVRGAPVSYDTNGVIHFWTA